MSQLCKDIEDLMKDLKHIYNSSTLTRFQLGMLTLNGRENNLRDTATNTQDQEALDMLDFYKTRKTEYISERLPKPEDLEWDSEYIGS